MPVPYITFATNHNSLLAALVVAALYPVLADEDEFSSRYHAFFGVVKPSSCMKLYASLADVVDEHQALLILDTLINERMRPHLAQYMQGNQEELKGRLSADTDVDAACVMLTENKPIPNDHVIINVIAIKLAATIRIYTGLNAEQVIEYEPVKNTTACLSVSVHDSEIWALCASIDEINQTRTTNIMPVAPIAIDRSEVYRVLYQKSVIRFLNSALDSHPVNLAGIHAIYDLCLKPSGGSFDSNLLSKNTVYLRARENALDYWVKGKPAGQLTQKELGCTIASSFSETELVGIKSRVINVLSNKQILPFSVPLQPIDYLDPLKTPYLTNTDGRILRLNTLSEVRNVQYLLSSDRIKLLPSQTIGTAGNWAISLAKSAGCSAPLSTVRFSVGVLVGMLSYGSVELGSLALASLPYFAVCMVASLGSAAVGKYYALEFEESLREAKRQLDLGNYFEVTTCLDAEFSRWFGARIARRPFLTKEHYALAHFMLGTSSLYQNEPDFQKAYEQFTCGATDARSANYLALYMVLQLQRISMLQQKNSLLVMNQDLATATITQILDELTELLPDAFADLYWKLNDKILQLSARLKDPTLWSADEIAVINSYLSADTAFILQRFAQGRGQFMDVYFSFFQSTVLFAMAQQEQNCLDSSVLLSPSQQLALSQNTNVSHRGLFLLAAIDKMLVCGQKLELFKKQHPDLASNQDIISSINDMKRYIKKLGYVICSNGHYEVAKTLSNTLNLFDIPANEFIEYRDSMNCTISFLTDLVCDFQQTSYETIEQCLRAIIAPNSALVHVVSPTTGDTLLHRLVGLRVEPNLIPLLKEAVQGLKHAAYVRNNQHQTPIYLLKASDPYKMLGIIMSQSMVKLGDQLAKVDEFVAEVIKNPLLDGHLLLLDGPPGTGKTTSVKGHLKNQGYTISEWSRGSDSDGRVGGLNKRIEAFFELAINQGQKTKEIQILFIDEIEQVTPLTQEKAKDPQYHSKSEDTATFLTCINKLIGHKVIVIGATNHPASVDSRIVSRASTHRIHFPLPDEAQRLELLTVFFRAKQIAQQDIVQLAKMTRAYSPRELKNFVEDIKPDVIDTALVREFFAKHSALLAKSFKEKNPCATLYIPSYARETQLSNWFAANQELADQMNRLDSDVTIPGIMHTLLYGPPGSGKTTAVRMFAQNAGRILISVEADYNISNDALNRIFEGAEQLAPSVIFFDEIHNLAMRGTPHGTLLQSRMDGMGGNSITIIGATNYMDRIEPAILSRFTSKIELPALAAEELGIPVKECLLTKISQYKKTVYVDSALQQELFTQPQQLGRECNGLSLRSISAAFLFMMIDLSEYKGNAITYLRLQDVLFTIFRMKVQEKLIAAEPGMLTSRQYITNNSCSFFPAVVPDDAHLIPVISAQPR